MQQKITDLRELIDKIEELISCEALELLRCPRQSELDLYIPYMLNDSVEYYYVLKDCAGTGDLKKEFDENTQLDLQTVENSGGSRNVIVLRRSDGEFMTLVFSSCYMSMELYQYHRIGHFWVKGDELWRRLVYIVGTVADKYSYLGEAACNQQELDLIPLIHFAPFRHFSPIRESIEGYYDESEEGYEAFRQLAKDAGDDVLFRRLESYHRSSRLLQATSLFRKEEKLAEKREMLIKEMAAEITKAQHRKLYRLICERIDAASVHYPVRDYGAQRNAYIADCRRQIENRLRQAGYDGNYPLFRRGTVQVKAYEEHPFVIEELDYHDFKFRIHLYTENGEKIVP